MARYEHLPIYKKAMELAVYVQEMVRHFSRYNKYTIGADLRDTSRRILLLVIRANSAPALYQDAPEKAGGRFAGETARQKGAVNGGTNGRLETLRELVECCDMMKTLLVFAKEARAFENFASFQHASGMAVLLCKQSEGWFKSSQGPELSTAGRRRVDECAHEHCAPLPPG